MSAVQITGAGAVVTGQVLTGELPGIKAVTDAELKTACRQWLKGATPKPAQLALAAVSQAMGAQEYDPGAGLVAGTCYANLDPISAFTDDCLVAGPQFASPLLFPDTVMNACAAYASMAFQLKGPTATVSSGLISGSLALGHAMTLLEEGQADRVVACGMDACPPPIVTETSGTVVPYRMAGGAVALQDGEPAQSHLAVLEGFSYRAGPLPRAGLEVVTHLFQQAGCTPAGLDLVLLAGRTGDPNDPYGLKAFESVAAGLERRPRRVLSLTEAIGDLLSASGPVAVAIACAQPGIHRALILDFDEAGTCAVSLTRNH